ncbi:MAG: peroxiredoxin [Bacteroidetes bacterium]|nr:peroxiredoxin [Bacteroidota bacterium]MCW5896314.1 peroxiredoxin [Bacteroidota bacterium]
MRLVVFLMAIVIAAPAFAGDPLQVGGSAPDFTLSYVTKDTIIGNGFTLSAHLGKNNIILAFYPANWSGGCTKEMCTMRDNFVPLAELGANVYGISGDYVWSHREWAKQLDLQFALLSDHDHTVAKMYSSYNPETGYNKRTVYVIDRSGNIAYIDPDYRVATDDSFNKLKSALRTIQ